MKDIKNIFIVALSTLGSRVTGLFRDIAIFSLLGASSMNSAFLFAFTLPNLFRRMFGEGALTSAFVPVFSEQLEHHGQEKAYHFFNRVFSWALLVLIGMVLICVGVLWGFYLFPDLEERWYLASDFGILMMPYMIFICLAAIVSAVLNVLGKFGVPALSAIWLNISMMLGVFVGYFFFKESSAQVNCICISVLVGGFLQLLFPAYTLFRNGWRPQWDLGLCPQLMDLVRLFLPGIVGAAIFQVNIGVSRLLAFSLNESAVSITYLANRLIEFPLGVFSIAITTVFFPNLARFAAQKNHADLGDAYQRGIRLILAITFPAAIGLMMLREPVLRFLFEWGHFNAKDVSSTQPVLLIYCMAIPFYSFATFATRGFHALKDTKTPVKIALWAFLINVIGTLLLMRIWGIKGLAAANVISVVYQTGMLHRKLVKKESVFKLTAIKLAVFQVSIASVIVGLYCSGAWVGIKTFFPSGKSTELTSLCTIMPSAVFLYYCVLGLLRFQEQRKIHEMMMYLVFKKPAKGE